MTEEYTNKESKDIEDFLNRMREKINKEAGVEIFPYKAKVVFIKDKK